jgi:hypothetical protein
MHVHQYLYISLVSPHHRCQVPPTLFLMPLCLFCFLSKLLGITFLVGLTIPQQFIVLLCKSSNSTTGEVHVQFVSHILSPCNMYGYNCTNSYHWETRFLSLLEYSHIYICPYHLESHSCNFFISNNLCFFGTYCLKMTLPFKRTIISTAVCSLRL